VVEDEELWRPRFRQYLMNVSVRRSEEDYFCAQVVNAGIDWLDRRRSDEPFFLWMDLFDPHEPWDPPAPYDTMYNPGYEGQVLIDPIPGFVEGYLSPEEVAEIAALYAGEVSFVDRWVGQFLQAVKQRGLWDDTLIVFTTDHGELLGERNCMRKARPWPYEELSRIPFLMHLPGDEGRGQVIDALTQTTDLMPTLLDAAGLPLPGGTHGASLLSLVRGECDRLRDFAISGFHGQSWSLRNNEWSLYLWLADYATKPWDPIQPNTRELYRLAQDPGETCNLIDQHPEVADRLELALRRFIEGLKWEPPVEA